MKNPGAMVKIEYKFSLKYYCAHMRTFRQKKMKKQKELKVNILRTQVLKWSIYLLTAIALFNLAGCSSTQVSNVPATNAKKFTHDYLIGPGDNLQIIVWRNAEVSMVVPVRPDGKISTPLVEDLKATGKTSTQLARDIEKMLSKYIQQPVVTVIVTGFVGPYSEQIRVIGQAANPQALPYRQDMSLMDVLIAVGGITDFASGNNANIIRSTNGKQQKINVRLDDLINDGDISANVLMMPGDILVIPESFF